jgi:hypothetical protein
MTKQEDLSVVYYRRTNLLHMPTMPGPTRRRRFAKSQIAFALLALLTPS